MPPVLESALVATIAGIGITTCFALGVHGAIRHAELRREQRPMLANLFGALAIAALATAAAAALYGLVEVA